MVCDVTLSPCPGPLQEDCALENVWMMGGLSILTSGTALPPCVCLLCASKGQHEVNTLRPPETALETRLSSVLW